MVDAVDNNGARNLNAPDPPNDSESGDELKQRFSAVLDKIATALGVEKTVFYNDRRNVHERSESDHDRHLQHANADMLAIVALFAQVRGSAARRRCIEALKTEVSASDGESAETSVV